MEPLPRLLETKIASPVAPEMKDGEYPLSDDHGLFYLCGVGQPDSVRRGKELARKVADVHLAVRPRRGSVAAQLREAALPIVEIDSGRFHELLPHRREKPQLGKDCGRLKSL